MADLAAGTIVLPAPWLATLAGSIGMSAASSRGGRGGNGLAVHTYHDLRNTAERICRGATMMTVRTLVPTLDRVLTLNRELDRVFTRNFGNAGTWLPSMDVVERADAFIVTLDVPGVSHDAIDLTFDRGALTIRGTRASAEHDAEDKIYVAERTLGEFERVVRLPETVDSERIQASFDRGVVTINIPKAATARARKIAITANGHQN